MSSDGLTEGSDNDDHELDSVHLLAAVDVREVAEDELAEEGADGGGDLESEILVRGEGTAGGLLVDHSDHRRRNVDGEDVVGIWGGSAPPTWREKSYR